MPTKYELKVPWSDPQYSKLGDIIICLKGERDPWIGTHNGALVVLSEKKAITIANLIFVPLDEFPLSAYDGAVAEILTSGYVVTHADLNNDYAFLTLVTGDDPYAPAINNFGPGAVLDLFSSIHEWGVLQARRSSPRWYRPERHFQIYDPLFESQVLDHPEFAYYVEWAARIFGSTTFQLQLEAERLVFELDAIPIGNDNAEQQKDAKKFELWCEKTVAFLLKNGFDPIKLHPNGPAFERRDVVATNLIETKFGKRIVSRFKVHHLVFECKNKTKIDKDDITQVTNYLNASYGGLGFVVYRAESVHLDEIGQWRFREIERKHGKYVIELTTGMMTNVLRNLSISWNQDLFDEDLCKLLDTYDHSYINEPKPQT